MRSIVLTVTAAALFVLASPSSAAPDRSATLSPQARSTTWSSEVGVGSYAGSRTAYEKTRCVGPFTCDATLLRITSSGDLAVNVTPRLPRDAFSVDLHLFRSDAAGTAGRKVLTRRTHTDGTESLSAPRLTAGYYLVSVEWIEGAGDYVGKATLTPARGR